jgi:EpsD family peptidyl-prolyl cis-trans isomerase
MKRTHAIAALTLLMAVALGGCNEKKAEEVKDVAAKVNGEAIGAGEVDRELGKAGQSLKSVPPTLSNQVLNILVEQRLLDQKARKDGMEKDPQVIRALQAAERQILAQAYLVKLTASAPKASDAEISEYYGKHPELFSQRRVYRLQELIIPVSAENVGAIKARMTAGANLNDLVNWLKSQNIPVRGNQSVKAAEQLPLDLAAKLQPLHEGQAVTVENPKQISVLVITGLQPQPYSEEQAKPMIERALLVAHKREIAKTDLEKLRAAAKIDYVAPFAEAKGSSEHALSAPKEGEVAEPGMLEKSLNGLK